jgi:hypothetical protein
MKKCSMALAKGEPNERRIFKKWEFTGTQSTESNEQYIELLGLYEGKVAHCPCCGPKVILCR